MPKGSTLAHLFELAIKLERSAETLYQELAAMFAHEADLFEFWQNYAQEESRHAQGLERIRANVSDELLFAPADPSILDKAYKMSEFSQEAALQQVGNMEDAFQLASELENSETNAIFDFLITNYSQDPESVAFARAQLTGHIEHLQNDLPPRFRTAVIRKSIRARN